MKKLLSPLELIKSFCTDGLLYTFLAVSTFRYEKRRDRETKAALCSWSLLPVTKSSPAGK